MNEVQGPNLDAARCRRGGEACCALLDGQAAMVTDWVQAQGVIGWRLQYVG